jgi:hypothetical protein
MVQPAAVQPTTGPGHQATQVSAAPTQMQAAQRPAAGPSNGGSPVAPATSAAPAATQANAKQAANGKEDEEDWWTE